MDTTGWAFFPVQEFYCTASANYGFIRKSDNNYLKYESGEKFFPIGENMAWGTWNGGFFIYDEWMDSLANNGANFIKIIMAPWSFAIEWENTGLGDYTNRQDKAFALDWVMDKAYQKSIYAQLAFTIHCELNDNAANNYLWNENPYNIENGGPCTEPCDFFTNTEAIEFYKRKLRHINARWGYMTTVSSWEILTEADNFEYYQEHKSEIRNWLNVMAQYIKLIDVNEHLVSASYAIIEHDSLLWNLPSIDFTQTHVYVSYLDDIELTIHAVTQLYLSQYNKPTIVGEFSLAHIPDTVIYYDPDGIAFHNSLWSSAVSGAFGAGLTWWWDNYIHPQNLYYFFYPLSDFMEDVDLLSNDFEPVSVFCTSDTNLNFEAKPNFTNLLQKAPENNFVVETTANLIPSVNNLGQILYGTGVLVEPLRNPPYFIVNYTKPGKFKVNTGDPGLSSTIQIWLDDELVLSQPGIINTTYSIDVPSGEHIIFVENSNNGFSSFITIEKYIFENYAPVLRSFALKNSNSVTGWFQNRKYKPEYFYIHGSEPPPVTGGVMNFDELVDGNYQIEWWNCETGEIDSINYAIANNGNLVVNAPKVLWDGAYKIDFVVNIDNSYVEKSNFLYQNYPNPFYDKTKIKYNLPEDSKVKLIIYNIFGKEIKTIVNAEQPEGLNSVIWDGKNNTGKTVSPGIYIYRIITDKFEESRSLIFIKNGT